MKKFIIGAGALLVPGLAFAVTGPDFGYFTSLFMDGFNLLNTYLIPILVIAATGYFFWTIIQYIRAKDATEQGKERHRMIQGVIGLTVMVAIWGIVALVVQLLGVGGASTPPAPCPPGYSWSSFSKKCN